MTFIQIAAAAAAVAILALAAVAFVVVFALCHSAGQADRQLESAAADARAADQRRLRAERMERMGLIRGDR